MERFIELLKYFVLALVQGVGEILPISSSGHLLVVRKIFNLNSDGMGIELVLHLASLLALFLFYRITIINLIKGCYKYLFKKDKEYKKDYLFIKGMIISLIPTCIVGYFLNDYLDYFLKYSFMIGVFLIINGINLYLVKDKKEEKDISELSLLSFIKIGIFQCFGLVPGVSRSGSTLSMCYREKLNKEDSEKFTFIMLFPLVIGSTLLNISDFAFNKEELILVIISFILTFIITLFSLNFLRKIIKSKKFHYFAYYCIVLGILVMFMK